MNNMLIDGSTDTIYLCMYRIGTLVFSVGDKKIQMDGSNVLAIEKADNFEHNLRSILRVQLRVDLRQKIWILSNKKDITCKFELIKFGMDTDVESEILGEQSVWNEEFSVFLNDDDAAIDVESMEQSLDTNEGEFSSNDIESQDYFLSQEPFDVYLYNTSLLNSSTTNINEVLSSSSINSAVGYVLTQSKHKNVVLSPIENDKKWDDIILPINSAYKQLVYLDQYYGLYKTGASIYYDVDALYIVNTNGTPEAVRKNEYPETNIIITQRTNSTPGNGMVRKQEQTCYYINVPEENVSASKPSDALDATNGESVQVITMDDVNVSNVRNDKNAYTAYDYSTGNPYGGEIIQARKNENKSVIYITGDNLDMNAFTINKEFHLIYEDTGKEERYGKGIYRLAFAHHYLVMQTNTYLKSSHQVVLKRCDHTTNVSE